MWLEGGEKAHYYVLSRFLVSRALTVTRIPHMKAVKIALELKKFCVDNDLLDISQVHSSRRVETGGSSPAWALRSEFKLCWSGNMRNHLIDINADSEGSPGGRGGRGRRARAYYLVEVECGDYMHLNQALILAAQGFDGAKHSNLSRKHAGNL